MREDSARMAAFATGQPTEVYLDDSRSGERVADVYEVDSISYPIDEDEIAKRLEASGKRKLVYTDGQTVHFFKLVAGTVAEIAVTPSDTGDMSAEIRRILSVFKRNSRFNRDNHHIDLLKGLILLTRGADPDTAEEAEGELRRIFAESDTDLDPGIADWDPLDHALKSLRENCPDAEPGELGSAYLEVFKHETCRDFDFVGTDVLGKVFSSLIETPCTMYHLLPRLAVSLPYGSILHAYSEGSEQVRLFCVLMGVRDVVDDRSRLELSETVVAFDLLSKGRDFENFLADTVDRMPEHGRLVIVNAGGILFGIRSERFRQKINSECAMRYAIRIKHGYGIQTSIDAVILVIEKTRDVAPTEFVTIPENVDGTGDWREWPGVQMSSTSDYGTDWDAPFNACYCIMPREGNILGNVAEVRKGTMITSSELFPSNAISGIPYVTPKNLTKDGLDLSMAKKAPGSVRATARPGDILVTCNSSVTRTYRMKSGDPVVAPSYAFAIVRPNSEIYYPEFLELYFRTRDFQEQAEARQSGEMMVSLSASELSKIVIPDVDLDTQADMIDFYREAVMNGRESDPDYVIFGKETDDDGE